MAALAAHRLGPLIDDVVFRRVRDRLVADGCCGSAHPGYAGC